DSLLQAARPRRAEEASGLGAHEPHPLVRELEGRLASAARLLRPDREQPLELALVGAESLETLADRREELDDRLADRLLQVAVASAVEAALERVDRIAGRDAHDLEEVRDARLRGRVVADLALRVRDRRLELPPDRLGRVGDVDRALLRREGGRHLARGLLQVH